MNSSSTSKLSHSLIFIIFLFLSIVANGQGIQGVISDFKGTSIPNATLIIEEINTGTSSNLDGEYKFNLPKGTYTVRYEAMGYKSERKTIVVNAQFEVVNVQLIEQVYQLKEVDVVKGEDPSYAIMRKAIASAPYHLNQVKQYSSDIYLKGTAEFKTIPWILKNKIIINDIPVKEGDVFTYESVNETDFQAPNSYQQRIVSVNTNLPKDFNIPNLKESFYQPELGGMISPFSPNAFSYYRFVYEGYSQASNTNICKIRVIPRRVSCVTTGY